MVFASAQQATPAAASSVADATTTLLRAAADASVASVDVFQALRTLEAAKMPTEGWPEVIGGTASPGRRWRLVFTSGTKQVQDAMKGLSKGERVGSK